MSTTPVTAVATNAVLGKDDFLKLLTTQLQYQDPLQPQDDTAFVSELAQFSSLEQMQDLNTNFQSLTTLQGLSQMNFAVNLVGHRVVGNDSTGTLTDGTVTNVNFNGGNPVVVVGNSQINMTDIVKIY